MGEEAGQAFDKWLQQKVWPEVLGTFSDAACAASDVLLV